MTARSGENIIQKNDPHPGCLLDFCGLLYLSSRRLLARSFVRLILTINFIKSKKTMAVHR